LVGGALRRHLHTLRRELLRQRPADRLVEIVATVVVPRRTLHVVHVLVDVQEKDVERAGAQIDDHDPAGEPASARAALIQAAVGSWSSRATSGRWPEPSSYQGPLTTFALVRVSTDRSVDAEPLLAGAQADTSARDDAARGCHSVGESLRVQCFS
jgi:hypothetical protein